MWCLTVERTPERAAPRPGQGARVIPSCLTPRGDDLVRLHGRPAGAGTNSAAG
jgi:hypothetical protein